MSNANSTEVRRPAMRGGQYLISWCGKEHKELIGIINRVCRPGVTVNKAPGGK